MRKLTAKNMIKFGQMKKGRIVLFACLSFLLGVGAASFLPQGILDRDLAWFSLAFLFLAIAVIFWERKDIRMCGLVGLFLFLGMWRYSLTIIEDRPDRIWHYNGTKITIAGMVIDEPDERDSNARLKLEVGLAGTRKVSGTVLAITNIYPRYAYGDKLELVCHLAAPQSGDDLAYDKYMARFGIYSICYYPQVKLLAKSEENDFYGKIFILKNKIRRTFGLGLEEPQAGLARGLILGDQKSLDKDLADKFSVSGLSHIIAVSGSNISILSAFVMNLVLWFGLSRRSSFYFSALFLFGYVILVGAPASAIRAGLMGFLVIWALYLGRLSKAANAIALAAVLMLSVNPRLLRYDIGFQLSFLAILGVSYIYPRLDEKFKKWRISNFFSLREGLAMTIAAQALTAPVIIYNFSRFSLVSILSNILIMWTMPVLMILLPIAVLIGQFWIFGNPLFWFSELFLKYVVRIAEWSAAIPYASLTTTGRGEYAVILVYYLALGWIIFGSKNRLAGKLTNRP